MNDNAQFCSWRCWYQATHEHRPHRPCDECGMEVKAFGKVPLCPDCSKIRKRERNRANCRRRRALKLGAASEPYTLAEIAERDRFRCGLCRRKVDMELPGPYDMSPSIDHIVPLSRGGDDTRANVQLAHWICNTRKGNRGGNEQLALIG